jgi:hypothetical protein
MLKWPFAKPPCIIIGPKGPSEELPYPEIFGHIVGLTRKNRVLAKNSPNVVFQSSAGLIMQPSIDEDGADETATADRGTFKSDSPTRPTVK